MYTGRFAAGVLAAVVCSSLVAAQTRGLQATNVISQTSIGWNRSVTGADPLAKLQFNDSRLANTAGGLDPSQVSNASGRCTALSVGYMPCCRRVS